MAETATIVRVPDVVEHGDANLIDPLKIADRCDRCGSQAFVGVIVTVEESTELLFCQHHFRVAYVGLLKVNKGQGPVAIRDERARLYADEGHARQTGDDHA